VAPKWGISFSLFPKSLKFPGYLGLWINPIKFPLFGGEGGALFYRAFKSRVCLILKDFSF